jgi:hypothetical protein
MSLTVRAYNVLFGDAILVSWDEDDGLHHAWIDFGNFHTDPNTVFEKVYGDVLLRTKGKLDLLVVTHRHLDHMEGFFSLRKRFAKDFAIKRLWHAHVTPATDDVFKIASNHVRGLLPRASLDGRGEIGRIFRNNFGAAGVGTKDRMDAILKDIPVDRAVAIHRDLSLAQSQALPPGLKRLKIEILAPEKNSSLYLQPLQHALALRGVRLSAGGRRRKDGAVDPFAGARSVRAESSRLLKLADLARLRRQLRSGGLDLLTAVDTTRNNTSIVMRWSYGKTRLLFTGDAEEKSWELMRKRKGLLGAHLVKVGHHGSINASPSWSYEIVLPARLAANAAVVSTDPSRFTGENEVPKHEVLEGWRKRLASGSRLLSTDGVALGTSVSVKY